MNNLYKCNGMKSRSLTSVVVLFLMLISTTAYAQITTAKVVKVSYSDTTKAKSAPNPKLRILSSSSDNSWMDEIDPNDIESVEVIKKDGVGVIKLTLKNGEIIEKTVNDTVSSSKSKLVVRGYYADDKDDYMIWEELEDIDTNDIASVDVTKKDGKGTVKITLKNGGIIEKIVSTNEANNIPLIAKTIELDEISYDTLSSNGNIFVYKIDEEKKEFMNLDAFKDLDEDDIKEVLVKVKDDVKTITVTTKDGRVLEEVATANTGNGANVLLFNATDSVLNRLNLGTSGNTSRKGINIRRVNQDNKTEALELRLERMEKKIDELLEALKKENTKGKKKN